MSLRPHESERLADRLADATAQDARDTPWAAFVAEIADARSHGPLGWAEATLAGIQATVERTEQVTPEQRAAVARILGVVYAPSRAYDKWGYGRRW